MVLWKKESVADNAMYVNLLGLERVDDKLIKIAMKHFNIDDGKKSDETAAELRVKGNEKFRANNWHIARKLYNKSLRYAPNGSESVALAYANRSTCSLKLEEYSACLVDIELAEKANYPQRLMPKLNQRKAECVKLMGKSNQVDSNAKPELSFDPDEKFPCMANVLEIRSNDEFGKHVVAKCDIEVGEIVLMDEYFALDATEFFKTCCETCHQFGKNVIPCPNCTDVMFCDVNCMQNNQIHRIACGSPYHRIPETTELFDTMLIAIMAFPNVEDLEAFVEYALKNRDFNDSPIRTSTEQSNYCLFLKLLVLSKQYDDTDESKCMVIYILLLKIPEMNRRFDTERKRRFLMHLIMQHILILKTNSYTYGGSIETDSIHHVSILSALFNHSCVPNLALTRCAHQMAGYIIRPVKAGEQLFIRYVDLDQPTEDRQKSLRERFQFECTCTKCVPCFKQKDCSRMQKDPEYQRIIRFDFDEMIYNHLRSMMMVTCREFLNKYGRLPWSEEFDNVLSKYNVCMNLELTQF